MRDYPAVKTQISRGKPVSVPIPPVNEPAFWKVFGLALCAVWLTYLPSLSGPFVFDDLGLPFTLPDVAIKPAAFWIGGVRPVLMASYWVNYLSSGQNPFAYRAVNLCLHALAASFVYLCSMSLLKRAGVDYAKVKTLAVVIAGIFLLHPLQTESVAYIAGRSEVLTGVFFFAAFAVFLGAGNREFSYARTLSILALTGAALLSKEHAVVLPILLVFTGVFWNKGPVRAHIHAYAKLYGSMLALGFLAGIFVLRLLANAPTAGFNVAGIAWYQYLFTQFRVIPEYVRLFVAPFGQNADWALAFSHTPLEHGAIFYGLALLAAVVLLFYWRQRIPLPAYGFLIFLLLLSPTSSVVPIRDALAERRMYLPIFGLALATAGIFAHPRFSRPALTAGVFTLLIALSGLSFHRSEVWGSDLLLWQDVVNKSPSNLRGYAGLGRVLSTNKRCAEAIGVYKRALIVASAQGGEQTPAFRNFLASAFVCDHQPAKARETLRSMAASESGAVISTELGVLAAKSDDEHQASEDFNQAIRLAPNYAPAYAYRGMLELATSADPQAERDFRRALELEPGNAFALDGLKKLPRSP